MKRFLKISTTVAALYAILPILDVNHAEVVSQDVTIKIKQDSQPKDDSPPFTGKRPAVDVAVLLDTSNSMDGLISQAKAQLWRIVQEFAAAEKSGQTPSLRVSVFEYGNSNLPAGEGYIRQVIQLTDDLDKVSEGLFSLKTKGGDEYCGMVIDEALTRLDWSEKDDAYKAIFIAGNEPFTQGSVRYEMSCKRAIESGVVVNTIHCGDYQKGISGKWKAGADIAEGEYMNINQDRKIVHYKAPQDKIIIELNSELNKTYLWFGTKDQRQNYEKNQYTQDKNATEFGGIASRTSSKVSGVYNNRRRDVVDALKECKEGEKVVALNRIAKASLPEKLQKMSEAEILSYVEGMTKKRTEIQKQLTNATKARAIFIADKQKAEAQSDESTLGDAITQAVRKQLKSSGFELKK